MSLALVRAQPSALVLERVLVWLVAAYLLAQCFSVPLVAVGPSWSLWPTLPDLCAWLIGGLSILYRAPFQTAAQLQLWRALVLVWLLALVAFAMLFVIRSPALNSELQFGLFNLFKLSQVLVVFWAVARLRPTPQALTLWRNSVNIAFVVAALTIVLSYFSPVLTDFFGFLPHAVGASGPWAAFYRHADHGLGLIGYNHGYVGLQIMMLAGLALLLNPGRSGLWVLALMLIASFLTASRAGLAGGVLFALALAYRTPLKLIVWSLGAVLLGAIILPFLHLDINNLLQRQSTILDPGQGDNLSGRGGIWADFLGVMVADPWRFLLGSGFGSAISTGGNAHFLLLQILFETGAVGLSVFFWLAAQVVRLLRRVHARVVLALLLGFAFTAFTQETFYPNPAFGGFLPLLAAGLALALNPAASERGISRRELRA